MVTYSVRPEVTKELVQSAIYGGQVYDRSSD
jgi:hypothetical protein